jgi:putative transposase
VTAKPKRSASVVAPSTTSPLKYEEVYLHGYDSVSAATAGIARYLTLYNTRRPHSSLKDCTPDAVYFSSLLQTAAA